MIELKSHICEFVYNIITLNKPNLMTSNLIIDGFYTIDNILYVLIDLSSCNLFINDINLTTNTCLGLIDEIINTKHIFGISIHPIVTDFFFK
jgi:hypothetical protein